MSRPIIFLDIDGVARPNTKPNNYKINKQNAELLNRAFGAVDADVVISSNWRLAYPVNFFNDHFCGRVVGMTSDFGYKHFLDHTRWHEIRDFMKINTGRNFCVLDDQADHFPLGVKQLILCDGDLGFTMKNFDELLAKSK